MRRCADVVHNRRDQLRTRTGTGAQDDVAESLVTPGTRQSGSAVALRFFAGQGLDAVLPGLKGSDAPWPCGQHWM